MATFIRVCALGLRSLAPVLLLVLAPLCMGFEWQGRVQQLTAELETASAERRSDILRLLSTYDSARARQAILGALQDSDATVRAEAAEACGRLRIVEAIPELSEWLLDAEGETRAASARALGAMGDAASLASLVRTLGDVSAEVRIASISALAQLGGPDVVTPIMGRLDDEDVSVRQAAAEALAGLHDLRAVVPLIGRARDDSAEVRVAVFQALGHLRDERSLAALVLGTRDSVEDVRLAAVLALGSLRSARAIGPLRSLLDQPDVRLRAAALDALAPIPDARASEVILDALSSIPGAQNIAMEALVRRAQANLDEALIPTLATRLRSASHQQATAIARVIAEVALTRRDARAVPALLETLRSGRGAAAPLLLALARLGGDDTIVPILTHLNQPESAAQSAALDALEANFSLWGPDGRAADPLLDALPRADRAAQLRIVMLLGQLGEPRALPALRPLLQHEDAALRRAALRAIGNAGDAAGAATLWPLLSDDDAQSRFEAAVALGRVVDSEGLERLRRELLSEAPRDRHALLVAVTDALARLAPLAPPLQTRLVETLGLFLRGRDRSLAARALHALAYSHHESGRALVRTTATQGHGALRHQALGSLGDLADAASLEILRAEVASDDPQVASAAASALGRRAALEAAGENEVGALLAATTQPWPIPVAASYALARLAQARRLGAHEEATRARLCELLARRDPHLRSNLLVGLAALGHERCGGRLDAAAWMASPHQLPVRVAAALFLRSADQAAWEVARQRCLASELAEELVRVCRSSSVDAPVGSSVEAAGEALPSPPPETRVARDVPSPGLRMYAFAGDETTLLVHRWIVLRFADGTSYGAFTDLNGYLAMRTPPVAEDATVRLELPESVPLER